MLKVRRTMTEILLNVTNREIYTICKEELQRHLKRAKGIVQNRKKVEQNCKCICFLVCKNFEPLKLILAIIIETLLLSFVRLLAGWMDLMCIFIWTSASDQRVPAPSGTTLSATLGKLPFTISTANLFLFYWYAVCSIVFVSFCYVITKMVYLVVCTLLFMN